MADTTQHLLTIYLLEYEKLKDEQIARIGFRDNLIYATLVAIGGIISFGLTPATNYAAILVLPLATFVLGWTYLNNDRKITQVGQYIRTVLAHRLRQITADPQARMFEWEVVYKVEKRRMERKILQLVVHQSLFVGSGVVAIIFAVWKAVSVSVLMRWVAGIELFLLLVLALELVISADFRRRREA